MSKSKNPSDPFLFSSLKVTGVNEKIQKLFTNESHLADLLLLINRHAAERLYFFVTTSRLAAYLMKDFVAFLPVG